MTNSFGPMDFSPLSPTTASHSIKPSEQATMVMTTSSASSAAASSSPSSAVPMPISDNSTHQDAWSSPTSTSMTTTCGQKRLPFGEPLGRFDPLSRDLRITGVSKQGSSWQYHIEVLDMRTTSNTTTTMASGNLTSMTYPMTQWPSRANSATTTGNSVHANDQSARASARFLPPLVRYSVQRRYRDFRRLYVKLINTQHTELLERLPPFPEAGLLSYLRPDDPKLLQHRQTQLEQFLRALDTCHETKWWKPFVRFLNPDLTQIDEWICTQNPSLPHAQQPLHHPGHDDTSTGNVYGPTSAPVALERASFGASGGYVSLSCVRSPQVRFNHQQSGRYGLGSSGDAPAPPSRSLFYPSYLYWKRRRLNGTSSRPNQTQTNHQDEVDMDLRESSTYNMLSRFVSLEAPL